MQSALSIPNFLKSKNTILLLSQMRSYSSLFGHNVGSSDEIDGYYEMHNHYFTIRSILKSKLQFLMSQLPSNKHRYFFDKILHNHLNVTDQILKSDNTKIVIMIRKPQDTLPSILKMANNRGFTSKMQAPEEACLYYINRIKKLVAYSKKVEGKYLFLESESFIKEDGEALKILTKYLELDGPPLSGSFNQFKHTSKEKFGDMSGNLKNAKIIITNKNQVANNYDEYFSEGKINDSYLEAKKILTNGSINI
jgi:hypothetical protein